MCLLELCANVIDVAGKKIRIRILSPPVKDEPSKPAINEQQPVGFTSHIREDRPASQSLVRPCDSVVRLESSIKPKNAIPLVRGIPKNATTSQLVSRRCVVKPESSIKPKDAIPVVQGIQNNAPSQSVSVDTTQLIEKTNASHDKGKSRESSVKLSSHDKRMLKNEAMRKNLFVNWAPPTLIGCDVDYDDEDWLFSKKDEDRPSKRARVDVDNTQSSTDNLPCSASVIQPRAQLLAEVGIHALPFTVPF